ncbi:MAG: lipopolysaccharide heptosyltransferase II [Ignavibacteria bacterium]|nr:lipopolysaccharide heptosyltransferase II [Ignavibacteria bacterium]
MNNKKILIIQTAFLGDVVLALPMVQTLKKHLPDAMIDFLCIPGTEGVLANHPDISKVIPYDKKGGDKLDKFIEILSEIREEEFDIVICPHRYTRSAILTYYSESKVRIGFDENSLAFLLTNKVRYIKDKHEIYRNLDLAKGIPGIEYDEGKVSLKPQLYPSEEDIKTVNHLVNRSNLIAFAPCSKWFTKQLTTEKSAEIARKLLLDGYNVVLIGGEDDIDYCMELESRLNDDSLLNLCGKTTALQSYLVISRSKALVSVDSAAQHLGAASDIPIILIYGSTNISFGFYPLTSKYAIVENDKLECRPCTDHGRDKCPLGHFKCIVDLSADEISKSVEELVKFKTG